MDLIDNKHIQEIKQDLELYSAKLIQTSPIPTTCEDTPTSNTTTPTTNLATHAKPQQRNAANDRERLRMRVLSKAFSRLKTMLPWVPPDTKLSKLDTLRLATCYITHLQSVLKEDTPTIVGKTTSSIMGVSGYSATLVRDSLSAHCNDNDGRKLPPIEINKMTSANMYLERS